jgi:hypothetical protein
MVSLIRWGRAMPICGSSSSSSTEWLAVRTLLAAACLSCLSVASVRHVNVAWEI